MLYVVETFVSTNTFPFLSRYNCMGFWFDVREANTVVLYNIPSGSKYERRTLLLLVSATKITPPSFTLTSEGLFSTADGPVTISILNDTKVISLMVWGPFMAMYKSGNVGGTVACAENSRLYCLI